MMTSQILISVDLTKAQKPRYLENELLFLQVKKVINSHIKGYFMKKKKFCGEGNLQVVIFTKKLQNF